jgi:hypothetical protein
MEFDILKKFVSLREAISEVKINGFRIEGDLYLNSENYNLLEYFKHVNIIPNITIDGRTKSVSQLPTFVVIENKIIKIELAPKELMSHGFIYFETFEEYLSKNKFSSPKKVHYVHELKYFSTQEEKPEIIKQANKAISLIGLLNHLSDHKIETINHLEFIFLSNIKMEISVDYFACNLRELSDLEDLEYRILEDRDKSKSVEIFRNTLFEFLKNLKGDIRFSHLLVNFAEIYERYNQSFSLYISEFNFSDIEKQYEDKKISYIRQINSTITDIQNKIIALPIAFIIAAGQMEVGKTSKNISLTLGAIILAGISRAILNSQIHLLDNINSDINNEDNELKGLSDVIYSKIGLKFIFLRSHIKNQRKTLKYINITIYFVVAFTCLLFLHFAFPNIIIYLREFLTNIFHKSLQFVPWGQA